MTPSDAAKLLDLPADATPEQLEARFLELRRKLEDKIAKAPTPGLQAKYRESLADITLAFETLTLAADSSSLPVIQKQGAPTNSPVRSPSETVSQSNRLAATSATRSAQAPTLHSKSKSGGKEFAIVAVIAVLILGAGGWYVIKARAENEEKARIAAEAKAEAEREAAAAQVEKDRLAQAARTEAEEKKKAEEAERIRLEKLSAQLRTHLAEAKVTWEAFEREERSIERKLGELKSDLRSLRDATPGRMAEARATVTAHQRYYDWLSETLTRHPAKVARGQAEELLSARQIEDAATAVASLKTALADLDRSIAGERKRTLDLDGELHLVTDASVSWQLEDAFSQVRTGTGPAQVDGIAVGPAKLLLRKPGWPDRTLTVPISAERVAKPDATYTGHTLELTSEPAGAEVTTANGAKLGVTPLRATELPPGKYTLTLSKSGHYPETLELALPLSAPVQPVALMVKPKGFERPPRWRGPAKVRVETRTNTQSTGPYGSTNAFHMVEEWDFSDPDPKVGWRQAIRRWVSMSGSSREYMPVDGSAVRLTRQADGSWNGSFIQGGLKNAEHNSIWASAPTSFWIITFGLHDLYPPGPVEIGGTWVVKPEVFFSTVGLRTATGKVQARLVNLDRDASGEWADVEYSYNYSMATLTSQSVLKLRVNVSDGYVVRMEGNDASTAGEINIRASYTSTVTPR